jgi:hypothetical protein
MLDDNTTTVDVSELEISSTDVADVGETEESAAKRTRTSPIAKVYALVDAFMAEQINGLTEQNADNEDPELDLTSMIELAQSLREGIADLRTAQPATPSPQVEGAKRRGRPKGSKNRPKDGTVAAAPKSAGAWYVGVAADGTRSAVKVAAVPSATSHNMFATVYGPFQTKRGAEYRAMKSDTELATALVEMPVVFA